MGKESKMKFKVLKHKTLEGMYGVIYSDHITEICESAKPDLFGIETTMDKLKEYYEGLTAFDQFDDYELVEVEMKEVGKKQDIKLKNKIINRKYRKIPIVIMKWDDNDISGYRAEIADNYENYRPAIYEDINFEDLSAHFKHDFPEHGLDYVFKLRKDALACAKFCNEKYLKGMAKIWIIR